jgi:hypothetical protein
MTALLRILSAALVLAAAPAMAHDATAPDASTLPKDVIAVSGVVPTMGEHWANPADLPLGPIYGVSNGKIIFIEYMVAQEDLANGKSFLELASKAGIDLPQVDHIDFNFEPNGHEGYEVPHYDVHLYFVPHAEHMAIAP